MRKITNTLVITYLIIMFVLVVYTSSMVLSSMQSLSHSFQVTYITIISLVNILLLILFSTSIYKIIKNSKHLDIWVNLSFVCSILLLLASSALLFMALIFGLFLGAMGGVADLIPPEARGPISIEVVLIVSGIVLWITYIIERNRENKNINPV